MPCLALGTRWGPSLFPDEGDRHVCTTLRVPASEGGVQPLGRLRRSPQAAALRDVPIGRKHPARTPAQGAATAAELAEKYHCGPALQFASRVCGCFLGGLSLLRRAARTPGVLAAAAWLLTTPPWGGSPSRQGDRLHRQDQPSAPSRAGAHEPDPGGLLQRGSQDWSGSTSAA